MPSPRPFLLLLLLVVAIKPATLEAQRRGRGGFPPPGGGRAMMDGPIDTTFRPGARDSGMTAPPAPEDARVAQREFERYRRWRLRETNIGRASGDCDEQIGTFCYWYDPKAPPPPTEDPAVTKARERLLALLDSIASGFPGDKWIAGQRVRYYLDVRRVADAERAASQCDASGPWCPQLVGLARHEASNFTGAEAAFGLARSRMTALERCRWGEVSMLLDDALASRYRKMTCEQKAALEDRFWWLARPFYGQGPNDARTEFESRLTMAQLLDGTASAYQFAFNKDEREMLIRYGWSRDWSKSTQHNAGSMVTVVGHEAVPAYPFVPLTGMFDYPWRTDSVLWSPDYRPALGRYGPSYAHTLVPLTHQASLFRRGDTAVLAVAWDARDQKPPIGPFEASLTVADSSLASGVARQTEMREPRGSLLARTRWGGVLFSAEVLVRPHSWAARARYGINPPLSAGARVTLSDLLMYDANGESPTTLEEAAARALGTLKMRASDKIGLYWELYGVDAAGEQATITITVIPETDEAGFFERQARRLSLMKATEPVSMRIGDQTTPGVNRASRAVKLDISTLSKGTWRIEIEVEVKGQSFALRSERTIEVTGK